ncbi:MAG: hypothetical protein KJ799_04410 [Bacteroidetes bacterium]|nr:hypothetical protein [Bacteroidota bacterium]
MPINLSFRDSLVAISSCNKINYCLHKSWLEQFNLALMFGTISYFARRYRMNFASPNGVIATIVNESINDKYCGNKLNLKKETLVFVKNNNQFNNPLTLEKAIENNVDYIGLVIPG